MAKGLFTQSACVLLSKPTSLDAITPLLSDFKIAKRIDEVTEPVLGGPSLIIAYRPEVNGYANVDVRDITWPDHMGDTKSEPMLFAAWSMGHYGPYAFPGGFRRAKEQLWAWPEGKQIAEAHKAFINIKTSYIFGADKDARVAPADYDPLPEMQFVTRLALALLKHPDALAYFNPNGEILRSAAKVQESLDYHQQQQLPPFDVWVNVRLFNPNNGWMIMDTVGMEQLDLPDLEVCMPAKTYNLQEVSRFLRNSSFYLLTKGEVIKHHDTMDGPGGIRWQAHHELKELCPPPRRRIRWFPLDGSKPPADMLASEVKPSLGSKIGKLFGRK